MLDIRDMVGRDPEVTTSMARARSDEGDLNFLMSTGAIELRESYGLLLPEEYTVLLGLEKALTRVELALRGQGNLTTAIIAAEEPIEWVDALADF